MRRVKYYGIERLGRAMKSSMKLDIGDLTQAIVDDILKFSGNVALADDLCLVAVEAVRNPQFQESPVEQRQPEKHTQVVKS